jgi:hypothetical protein
LTTSPTLRLRLAEANELLAVRGKRLSQREHEIMRFDGRRDRDADDALHC